MKYSIEQLIRGAGAPQRFLFFWGHTPPLDGSISQTCFSQWYESPFEVEGDVYPTAEHWMMAEKARLFNDQERLDEILTVKTPGEAKKLGRAVQNFDQSRWEARRFDIVKTGNLHKFEQNPAMKAFLLGTGHRVLVEASPLDAIWGIGLAKDHGHARQPQNWRGLNLLGFALMEVRDQLSYID
ncbi:NADAR family protein [Pontibacter sp. G13]|uniref:NADAR family protein n=1 Tax=Pontibacter sp. G13 TaxID=3074898 RepID=UPI00288AA1E6|nr:NADAR family protein [Pontibacter sp. G13]WNJ19860.1 NADAR family protein [Pontibacter sp. G13]